MASSKQSKSVSRLLIAVCYLLSFYSNCKAETVSKHNHPKALLPLECCEDMVPIHPFSSAPHSTNENSTYIQPQDNKNCPFSAEPMKNRIKSGESVQISIYSNSAGKTFKGYVVMAFDKKNINGSAIGSFENVSNGRFLNCPRGPLPQSAVTHDDNDDKTFVTVDWLAPKNFTGEIVFVTTYVQDYYYFWNKVQSAGVVTVSSAWQTISSPVSMVTVLMVHLTLRYLS